MQRHGPVAGEQRPLLFQSPPPPYHRANNPLPADLPADYPNSVGPGPKPRTQRRDIYSRTCVLLLLVVSGLIIVSLLVPLLTLLSKERARLPDSADRARIRLGWQKELDGFAAERARWLEERDEWDADSRTHKENLIRWAAEHAEHEASMKRRAKELARQMGSMWGQPRGEPWCNAYDSREYSVTLNTLGVCEIAPIAVGDHITMAETCEVEDRGQVVGRFKGSGDPFCHFTWYGLSDKGCITRGETSGTHTYRARMSGLHGGDRREIWLEMCNTTPATVHDIRFPRPTRCTQDQNGMIGEFDYDDPNCTWGNLRNAEVDAMNVTVAEYAT